MCWSRRFLSSCWSSSFVVIGFLSDIEQKEVARQTAQNHAFEPIHVIEAIAGSFLNGGDHPVTGVVPDHAQQLPPGKNEGLASVLLERGEIGLKLRDRLQDRLLLRRRRTALDTCTA